MTLLFLISRFLHSKKQPVPVNIHLTSLLFLLLAGPVFSQKTTVHGQLLDASNGDPLAYANVQFQGENGGKTTDINGLSIESK